jgi:hypothetical protein
MPEHFATVLKEFFRYGAVPIIFGGAEDAGP